MVQHINIVKYREIPNNFCLGCRLALKILLIIKLFIIIFNLLGYSIYLFNIPQYLLTFFYDVAIIIVSICCFSLVNKFKYVLISILGFFIIVIYGTNVSFYNENTVYDKYTSLDNKNVIVTKSNGYLFSGKTNFYYQHGIILENTNTTIQFDEGYQQFRNAETDVIWGDGLVTFNYYDENNVLLVTKDILL